MRKMIKHSRRMLALLLAVVMVTGILPVGAFAVAETETFEIPAGATVVYLDGTVDASGDGSHSGTAVKTLAEAYEKLDAGKAMNENVIIVCNDTTVDLSASHQRMPAKNATIMAQTGKSVTLTAVDTGESNTIYNKLIFEADTQLEGLNLAFGTHGIQCSNHKFVLNVTGVTGGLDCTDAEVYGGTYPNIYVGSDGGKGTVTIHGGKVTNLAASAKTYDQLRFHVLGGEITNLLAAGRWDTEETSVANLTVVLGGNAKIAALKASANGKAAITSAKLLLAGFTGTVPATVNGFENFGVAALGDGSAQDADFTAACALAAGKGQNKVYVDGVVTLANGTTLAKIAGITTVAGSSTNAALKLAAEQHRIDKDLSFQAVALDCAGTESKPTLVWYEGDVNALTLNGSYLLNSGEAPDVPVEPVPDGGIYLSGSGDDANNGSAEHPVKTLTKAYELLSASGTLEENVIIVCGDTEIDLSAGHLSMPAKKATIMAQPDKPVTLTATDAGTSSTIYNKLIFTADTHIKGVNFEFGTHNVMNTSSKLIMDITGAVGGLNCKDTEIYGGSYVNVEVNAENGVVTFFGGSVTKNLRATSANCTLMIVNYTAAFPSAITGFAKVGVTAGLGSTAQDAAMNCASSMATVLMQDTVYVQGPITLAGKAVLASLTGKTVAGLGENAAINLSGSRYTIKEGVRFSGVALNASENKAAPTVLQYYGDVQPVLGVTPAGHYTWESVSAPAGVYLDGTNGNDANEGTGKDDAVKTLAQAYALLDANKDMEENIIIVCGDTEVLLDKNPTYMPAIPATITSIDPDSGEDYKTKLKATGTLYYKLGLKADTTFRGVKLEFGSYTIYNVSGKTVMDMIGTVSSLEASDSVIYGGEYVNVYICNNAGFGSATLYGGHATNVASVGGQTTFEKMEINIFGSAAIDNVLAGGRFSPNKSSIKELVVTLSGTPGITIMNARGTCEDIGVAKLVITDYTGNAAGMQVTGFDEVGVAAGEGEETASVAALQAALQFCDAGGIILVYNDIVADVTTFPQSQGVTIKGDSADRTISFTKDYYVFAGSVKFDSIKLAFSEDKNNPTQLYYTESKGKPDFATAVVSGYCQFNPLADANNGLVIDFGKELTKQEQEGFAPITATNSYEEFQQIISRLPEEVPVLKLYDTGKDYAIKIFVATNGSDETGNGTITNPYKTPYKALEAAANVSILERDKGVAIYFRGGNYKIDETLTIDASVIDILTGMPLIISSYNNETVKFVGGETIYGSSFQLATEELIGTEDWNRLSESARGKVYVADLKAMGITEYFTFKENKNGGTPILSVNNSKLTLARYPDVGEVNFKSVIDSGIGGGSCVELVDLEPLTWKNTGSIYVRGSFYAEWAKEQGLITKIDSSNNSITTNRYMGWGGNELRPLYDNTHYYLNVFEELTIPGEWYLDYETGYLYIYPENGTMAATDEINLSTSDADYMLKFTGASNVLFNGIGLVNGLGAVRIENSENVLLQKVLVQDMSGYGIDIYNSFKCGAIYSTVTRTGYVAFQSKTSADSYKNMQITRSFLQNCLIYETDVSATTVNGIGDIFSHNTIHHTKSMAVGVQGTECIFEYNEMTSQSYDQADAGTFYFSTAGQNRGNVVRYNYIHDSNPVTSHARGIYMDDATCGNYAYGNIIENMEYGIFVHCGDDNVYIDNTVIGCTYPITIPDAYVEMGGHPTQGGTYRYAGDASNWYRSLNAEQKAAWDAHFPMYSVMIEATDKAVEQYEAGNETHEDVLYAMNATGNVLKDNIIVNGAAPNVGSKAAAYTKHEGTQLVSERDYSERTTSSKIYLDIGFNSSIAPGASISMSVDPILLSPAPDSHEVSKMAHFKWTPIKGASYYKLTVARNEELTENARTVITVLSEYSMKLSGMETDYYWQVEAVSLAKYNYNQPYESDIGHFVYTVAGDYSGTDILHYTPVMDGKRDEAYDSSVQVKLGTLIGAAPDYGMTEPSDKTSAVGSLAWDEEFLYVYLDVYKSGIYSNPLLDAYKQAGNDLYHDLHGYEDSVELMVNDYRVIIHADGDSYYCTMPGWDGEVPCFIIPDESGYGYSLEFAVPIDEDLKVGGKVDLHLMVNSVDPEGWEDYLAVAEEYGIDKNFPHTEDKLAIQATPVFQYRNDNDAPISYTFSEREWLESYKILKSTPVIDGQKDAGYNYSAGLTVDRMIYALPYNDLEETPTTGKLNMLWDESNLYYFIDITTNGVFSNPLLDIYKETGQTVDALTDQTLYEMFVRFEDCVQLMLETASETAHTTTLHADGLNYLNTMGLVCTYVATAKEDGTGYYIEAAIPWGDFRIAAEQEIELEFHVDSVDGNGKDPEHEGKTKWEVFMEYVEKYGVEETCPDTRDRRAIRRIPLYQYRQEITVFKLSSEVFGHVHSGGSATCSEKAKCVVCGAEYGDFGRHNYSISMYDATHHWDQCSICSVTSEKKEHTYGRDDVCDICRYERTHVCGYGKLTEGKEATCAEPGAKDYYTCRCGKQYLDAAYTEPVANEADLVIPRLEHVDENQDGLCDVCNEAATAPAPADSSKSSIIIIIVVIAVLAVAAAVVAVVVIKKKNKQAK